MNSFLIIILAALIGRYLLDLVADWLNLRHVDKVLPDEFKGCYDEDKYRASQEYLKENTGFGVLVDTIQTTVAIVFILTGGFNFVDRITRSFDLGSVPAGLVFAGILVFAFNILKLPFSVYETFVIENKYGFNRTTPKTFVLDVVKSFALTAVVGGLVFAAVLWFFEKTGGMAWIYCWVAMSAFQIFMIFIAPYLIMPLFNKFTPLEDGELKSAVQDYAGSQNFKMRGVFKMDGSRRSAKTNAFFTGFGRSRRIVLLDTLIDKHPLNEIVSIVAHEMGHYKKRHIRQAIVRSIAFSGLTFFLLSLFIGNERLFAAFKMEDISVYAGLFFFGFLYTPIATIISIVENAISRRHEYEADAFAVRTCSHPDAMIEGLKRLSADNLTNLTPHPLKVFLAYSHPPVIHRISAIRNLAATDF